jgi:hypothetical protein
MASKGKDDRNQINEINVEGTITGRDELKGDDQDEKRDDGPRWRHVQDDESDQGSQCRDVELEPVGR